LPWFLCWGSRHIGGTDLRHRFYCASAPSFHQYIKSASDIYPGLFPLANVKQFITEKIPNVLTCAGETIGNKSIKTNHLGIRKFAKIFTRERQLFLLDECNWAVDNGGFQLSRCLIPVKHLAAYSSDFYDFIQDEHSRFDFSFTLDLVPAVPTSKNRVPCLFSSAKEMYEYNFQSYVKAASLPPEVREKMRCVFHFRGPRVFRVWQRLLIENNLAAHFSHFSTGGLVDSQGVAKLPIYGFAIPLVPLLVHCKTRGKASFDFHVLGQSQPLDIIAMRFVEEHIKTVHGVDVHFTHDALSPINEASYRDMVLMDSKALTMRKAGLKSDNAGFYFDDGRSAIDALYDIINYDLAPYGLGPFDVDKHPYMKADGVLTPLGYALGIINATYNRTKMWHWAGGIVRDCYPIYSAGETQRFKTRFAEVIGDVICPQSHDNRIASETNKIAATLDFITRLDPDYADSLVCSRLVNEEHPELQGGI